MDAIITAAIEYVKLAFSGGISDAADGDPVSNAQDESFRALVAALRSAGHIPAHGQATEDWVRGQ
jgi:hypothetical protein